MLREEQRVIIDGIAESWRIVWRGQPEPICDLEAGFTCACRPYAYGETGVAELIRSRAGYPDQVLPLAQVFVGEGDVVRPSPNHAILRRWPVHDPDFKAEDPAALAQQIRARPVVRVMELQDYNHDGWAAEFELAVDTTGCADLRSVIVGVTRERNQLHALSSVTNPTRALLLQPKAWKALLSVSGRPATTVEFECDFRGGDTQVEVELKALQGRIFATRREYACPKKGPPRSSTAF
ncbi:MAG: hypothetical protein ACOY0T_12720 [Myxococcota bacterium]